LIVVEGDEHKFQRKHATPAFSFRHIKELYPLFWSKATDLAGRIAAEIHANPEPVSEQKTNHLEGVVEINHWANKATMDIIGVAGMQLCSSLLRVERLLLAGLGRDFNTLYNSDDELIASYEEILEPTFEKALFFGANLMFSPRFVAALPWKLNERLAATMGILREVCKQLVRDKKDLLATQKEQQSDILSILIRSNNFADEMLVDQLLTFLAAG
jgi:cytochrome P450